MKFKKTFKSNRAQTAMEYLIILTLTAAMFLIGFAMGPNAVGQNMGLNSPIWRMKNSVVTRHNSWMFNVSNWFNPDGSYFTH